jgi:hypothetical protein
MSLIKLAALNITPEHYEFFANKVTGAQTPKHREALLNYIKQEFSSEQYDKFNAVLKAHEDHWKARAASMKGSK